MCILVTKENHNKFEFIVTVYILDRKPDFAEFYTYFLYSCVQVYQVIVTYFQFKEYGFVKYLATVH